MKLGFTLSQCPWHWRNFIADLVGKKDTPLSTTYINRSLKKYNGVFIDEHTNHNSNPSLPSNRVEAVINFKSEQDLLAFILRWS